MTPAQLRSQNFIPHFDGVEQEGYQTQVALQYDKRQLRGPRSKKPLAAIGYDELRAEQAQARAAGNGRHLGIGFSTYIEACGIAPSAVVGALGCARWPV